MPALSPFFFHPVASIGALGFYLLVLGMLLVPPVRRALVARIAMPRPATQSALAGMEALRGLASLWVAMFHAWYWTRPVFGGVLAQVPLIGHGTKAVAVFAGISGLLVYRSLRGRTGTEDLRRYAIRRIFRIYPLYAAAIAFVALFSMRMSIQDVVGNLAMTRAFGSVRLTIPQTWSLYVEELFYFLLPLFVITSGRRIVWTATAFLLAFALADVAGARELSMWKYFLVGVLACEAIERLRGRFPEWAAWAVLALGIALLAVDTAGAANLRPADDPVLEWLGMGLDGIGLRFDSLRRDQYTVLLAAAIGCILVGTALSKWAGRILSFYPLYALGVVSYSLYLWHGLILSVVFSIPFDGIGGYVVPPTMVAGLLPDWTYPAVILPAFLFWAILSFLLIERPFLLLRPRSPASPPELAARPEPAAAEG